MEEVTQIRRNAAGAPPVSTSAPRSVFDWRLPPADAVSTAPTTKGATMPKTKPQPTGKASTQEVICRALDQAGGSATREALATASGIDARALQNAIYNACQAKRVRRTGDQIELTSAGKKWIGESTATTQPSPKRAHKKATKPRPRKAPAAKVRTAKPVGAEPPIERIATSSCKCAVFSDGSFVLEKEGAAIALTADEYQAIRTDQQRMHPADGAL